MVQSPGLEGKRTTLRPTGPEDLIFLETLWNDGEVMRYVGYPKGLGIDEEGMRTWFDRLAENRGRDREHWIVEVKGEPIGEAFYRRCDEYCGYRAPKMAELDLKLKPQSWGRGYGSNALRTLATYLFAQGFKTLVVSPNLENKAALRLYERLGFEAKLRFRAEETGAMHEVLALTEPALEAKLHRT